MLVHKLESWNMENLMKNLIKAQETMTRLKNRLQYSVS